MRGIQTRLLHQRVVVDRAVDVRRGGAALGRAQREDSLVDDRVLLVALEQLAHAVDRLVGIQLGLAVFGDLPENLDGLGRLDVLDAVHDDGLRLGLNLVGGRALGRDALDGAGAFQQFAQVSRGIDAVVVLLQAVDLGVHLGDGLHAVRHVGQNAQQHLAARGHRLEQRVDALGRGALVSVRDLGVFGRTGGNGPSSRSSAGRCVDGGGNRRGFAAFQLVVLVSAVVG